MKHNCVDPTENGDFCIACLKARVGALFLTSRRNFAIVVDVPRRQDTEIVWHDRANSMTEILCTKHGEFFGTELVK